MSTNRGEFRSDLIGARMMWSWMSANAPHLVGDWTVDTDEFMTSFIERVLAFYPPMPKVFSVQMPIAGHAINHWNLKNVVLLGGGRPTPFSPTPDQLMYYTDASPSVIAEARDAGYRTEIVDIRNRDDFKKVPGATTAIATGLFHFLPDEAARGTLRMLLGVGIKKFVYNNMRWLEDEEENEKSSIDEWAQFGMKLYPRNPEQMAELVSGIWTLTEAAAIPGHFYDDHSDLGPLFADDSTAASYVYLLTAP